MIKKYPFTKQEGLKDCAAACMQMIIKYYNGYLSIEDLNEQLKTNKEGVTAYNIIKTANNLGFEAEGIRIDELRKTCLTPTIAHVTLENKYDHYIVIYKINSNSIVIADPQSKIKKIKMDEFIKIFNNVLIIMYPKKPIEFKNYSNSFNIINLIKNEKRLVNELLITSFIYMALSITSSFYMKYLMDKLYFSKTLLIMIFIFFILIKLHQNLTNFIRMKILLSLNKKIDAKLSLTVFMKILNLPYNYYRNKTTGEIITRYNELPSIREAINKVLLTVFLDIPLAIFSISIMLLISPKLSLIAIIIIILYALTLLLFKNILKEAIEKEHQKKAQLNTQITESIVGIDSINSLRIKNYTQTKFETLYIKHLKQITKIDEILNLQNTIKEIINSVGEMTLIFYGIILIKNNQLTIGSLLSFNAMLVFFLSPIRNLLSLDFTLIEAKKIIKKLNEMIIEKKDCGLFKQNNETIKIENLTFSYNDNEILKDININFSKGEKIIITGKSGSGKSTLLKLLMKYYDVNRGMIKIGDKDINDIIPSSIYVSQNETLFTDTIYNNIVIDNSSLFEEVIKCCHVDEIITSKLGYNQVIEENGFNISGGQKQRIILARALNRNSNLLLIDEGLNQIDVNLERKILKKVFTKFRDKTIIIVSHRLVNMDLYDRFIEIENGKIKTNAKR